MSEGTLTVLEPPEGDVVLLPAFFPPPDADRLLRELLDSTRWRQESVKLFGKSIDLPRLTAWYGDEGTGYTYSGIANVPLAWTPPLLAVKQAVEAQVGAMFNSVLLNRYRTGKDGVAWHSDDEPEFGDNPVIGSVSVGGTRTFQFRHKRVKNRKRSIDLTHGSLLVMRGATQHNWVHQIPKTAKDVPERLNLTFRVIKKPA